MLHGDEALDGSVLAHEQNLGRMRWRGRGNALGSHVRPERDGKAEENERNGSRAHEAFGLCSQEPRFTFARSRAVRSPRASRSASSFAQKCMKKRCGESSIMWLCNAVTSIPCSRNVFRIGLTSLPSRTKSPVIAALPPPVGWKLSAVAVPIDGGTLTPPSETASARGMLNW